MKEALMVVNDFAAGWLDALVSACWQGGLAISLVWVVCRAWPQVSPRTKCWLWRRDDDAGGVRPRGGAVKTIRLAAAILAALFLQTSLSPLLARAGIGVDFGLVVVVFAGLTMGPSAGLLTGSVTGLIQDAIGTGIVGISGLSKTLVGFAAGVFGTMFSVTRPLPRFMVFFLASLADSAVFAGLYAIFGARAVVPSITPIVVRALVNATIGVSVFLAIELWPRYVERRRLGRSRMRVGRT